MWTRSVTGELQVVKCSNFSVQKYGERVSQRKGCDVKVLIVECRDPERMKGWVGLVGWPTADGLPNIIIIIISLLVHMSNTRVYNIWSSRKQWSSKENTESTGQQKGDDKTQDNKDNNEKHRRDQYKTWAIRHGRLIAEHLLKLPELLLRRIENSFEVRLTATLHHHHHHHHHQHHHHHHVQQQHYKQWLLSCLSSCISNYRRVAFL